MIWKDLRIGGKLGIGFGSLILMLMLSGGIALWGSKKMLVEFEHMAMHTDMAISLEQREKDHLAWLADLSLAMISGTVSDMQLQLDDHQCGLGQWYYGEGRLAFEQEVPALSALLNKLASPHSRLHQSAAAIKELHRAKEPLAPVKAEEVFQRDTLPALTEVRGILQELVQVLELETEMVRTSVLTTAETVRTAIMVIALGAILFGIIMAVITTLAVSRPLSYLTKVADRIAAGNLDETINISSRDETGQLAQAFNRMTQVVMKNLRGEIAKSDRLITNVKEAIQQLSTSANEIMAISVQQASGATEQASAVQQATTTSEEIAVTARQVAENAVRVEALAEQSKVDSSWGVVEVEDANQGMGRLKEQVQSIAVAMLKLGEDSQKIGGIIDIIDEISDQTNLLALNAAIEAAGAGEAGKRFSIVASEVKRLAQRTVDATAQIKSLIEQIQKATNSTIMLTEEGTKGVDSAGELVARVGEALSRVLTTVRETTEAAREIKFSTQQQTTASEQMAETVAEVRDVASQVAASAEETTQAIADLTTLAERLKELVGEDG